MALNSDERTLSALLAVWLPKLPTSGSGHGHGCRLRRKGASGGPSSVSLGLDEVNLMFLLQCPRNLSVVVVVGGEAAPSVLLPRNLRAGDATVSDDAGRRLASKAGSGFRFRWRAFGDTRIWQAADFTGDNFPLSLDGVSVPVDGESAAVYYISPVQLNVQAPADISTGTCECSYKLLWSGGWYCQSPAIRSRILHVPSPIRGCGAYRRGVCSPAGYFGSSTVSRPALPGEIVAILARASAQPTPQ